MFFCWLTLGLLLKFIRRFFTRLPADWFPLYTQLGYMKFTGKPSGGSL
jgi:hypothetical protein